MSSNQRRRRSVSEWSSIIADHRVSGLSARAYCDRSDLALSTFAKWRRRTRVTTTDVGFVAVGCETQVEQPNSTPNWDLELDLGDGMTLRLRRSG